MSHEHLLLIIFLTIAIVVSFLCSVLEAVLLSITPQYLALLRTKKSTASKIVEDLKKNINKPLTAILTLNTIAHTVGASGVGAQVIKIYGNEYLAIASAILTVLILFLSEIIPKTLGTNYWKTYAIPSAYLLRTLTSLMTPVIILSEWVVKPFKKNRQKNFRLEEMLAMAELAQNEGAVTSDESRTIKNILQLRDKPVRHIMTPRSVVFALSEQLTVANYFHKYNNESFSRIVLFQADKDDAASFVMRQDLLLAKARGNDHKPLSSYARECPIVFDKSSVTQVFSQFILNHDHLAVVVNEYGTFDGIVTLEDIFEEMIGQEIIDEHDHVADMQKLAKSHQAQRYDHK